MENIKKMFADENTRPQTRFIGQNYRIYNTVDSTNTTAKEHYSLPDGTVFISKTQTSGRGRLGRSWVSDDSGLWFSILLKPEINPENISQITLIAGLAVCEAIGIPSKIKWPNDIVLNSKKVCGILTELKPTPNKNCIILGIGINVYNFPSYLSGIATSLNACGINISNEKLLKKILEKFEKYYIQFINYGFGKLKEKYTENCITLGKDVIITENNKKISAKAIDISDDGKLIIDDNKNLIKVSSGEVSVRGIFGYL